ncbi:MAG: DNA starvation/stationary phase protection protein [Propionibacteriaceae bacterium]|nr:DNA starvation/stationary phase protection protein [Propionibacteriaceae bacterium]
MTTTQATTPSTLAASPEIANGAAQFLTPVVIDLEALVVDGKQAHWHVRGASFAGVHESLDALVSEAQEFADLAAERVIALGLPLDSRIRTVAEQTTLPALPEGFQGFQDCIKQVVSLIDAALVTVRAAVDGLDEVDLNSQDVAIEIERGLTKRRWLLDAHVAN